jgi:ferric-dicitrate binding protein FerR (iron transport regulator)
VPNHENEKWIKLYKAALLEAEPYLVPVRIADARAALTKRLEALQKASASRNREYQSVEEALNSLRLLEERRERKAAEEEQRNQRKAAPDERQTRHGREKALPGMWFLAISIGLGSSEGLCFLEQTTYFS